MKKSMLLVLITLISWSNDLFAQNKKKNFKILKDPCYFPKQLKIEQTDTLLSLLRDPKITVRVKTCTTLRLNEIYAKDKSLAKNFPKDGVNVISNLLDNYKNAVVNSNHPTLRIAACEAIVSLENAQGIEPAISKIIEVVQNDLSTDVQAGCINALIDVEKNQKKVVNLFNKMVLDLLVKEPIQEEDIKRMNLLVTSLGRLKQNSAYLVLIRVLESAYPPSVKKAAEFSLEQLEFK